MVFAGFFLSRLTPLPTTPVEIPDAVFVTGNFDVSGATLIYTDQLVVTPTDIEFKTDGTKLFVSLQGSSTIYEYSLSTAWDFTTVSSSATTSLSVSNMSEVQTIDFNRNGTKLYACGSGNVAEFSLSSAYDLSTAGSQSTLDISVHSGQTIYGACFSNSVSNNYLHFTSSGTGNVNTISTLEIASPLSGSTFLGRSANVVPFINSVVAPDLHTTRTLEVSGGGSRFYQIYRNTDFSNVHAVEFKLGTPHDASTLTSVTQVEDYFDLAEQSEITFDAVYSLKIKPDGSEMFLYGSNVTTNSNVVNTYSLDVPTPGLRITGDQDDVYDIWDGTENVTATGSGVFSITSSVSKTHANALTFNNTTSTDFTVPNFASMNTLPLTVSGWFYKTNTNTNDVILSSGNYSTGTSQGWAIFTRGSSGTYLSVFSTGTLYTDTTVQTPNYQWNHFVIVIDSGSCTFYINGELTGKTTTTYNLTSSNYLTGQSLVVGNDLAYNAYFFGGYMNDIRVHSGIIPEKTAKKMYLDGLALFKPQAFHLTFEDNTGADILPSGASLGGTSLSTLQSTAVVYQGNYSGYFAGASSNVTINNWTAFDHPFTFSMWLYQTDAVLGTYRSFGGMAGYSGNGFRFYTWGSNVYSWVTGGSYLKYTVPNLQNNWFHLTFTSTGSSHALYIDGVEEDTSTTSTSYTAGQTYTIGYIGAHPWNGYIDDFRIYDYVLDPKEVEYLYTSTVVHKDQIFYLSYDQSNVYEYHDGTEDVTATGSGTYIQDPGSKIGTHSGQYPQGTTGTLVPSWTDLTSASKLIFSFWIFPKVLTNYHVIFGTTGFASGTTGIAFELFKDGSGNLQFRIYTRVSSSNRYRYVSLSNADTYLNKWTHIVCTYTSSSTTSKIFINGVEQTLTASGTWSFSGIPTGDDLRIGNYNGTSSYEFNGAIDDFRVFSRALPDGEIEALYREYTQSRIYTLDVPTP